jgi:hypothetical protein
MTSANLLSRLRTLLDESSAGFWTDNECYAALSDGQNEIVNILFQRDPYNQALKTLWKEVSITGGSNQTISIPSDFKEIINAEIAITTGETKKACKKINYDDLHLQNSENSYLKPIIASPVIYVKSTTSLGRKIYFEPSSASSDYTIVYLTQPIGITNIAQPTLPLETQESMIVYAFSFLLRKDLRQAEADSAYKLFLDMVGKL